MFNFFKKKEMPQTENLVEINLGENDFIVFSTEKVLTLQQRENMKASWDKFLSNKDNKFMVLEGGIKFTVVHRK